MEFYFKVFMAVCVVLFLISLALFVRTIEKENKRANNEAI
tara:strand:+ start:2536 stop:2655 length:120 start_codon:yes stop_codon:yes gene_type:complete